MYPFSIRDLQTDAMFVPALQPSGPLIVSPVRQAVTEAGDRMLDDELIRVGALVAYAACRQMTPQYLQALHDSVEQACCLPSRFDWDRKAASHAEIVTSWRTRPATRPWPCWSGTFPGSCMIW